MKQPPKICPRCKSRYWAAPKKQFSSVQYIRFGPGGPNPVQVVGSEPGSGHPVVLVTSKTCPFLPAHPALPVRPVCPKQFKIWSSSADGRSNWIWRLSAECDDCRSTSRRR